MRPGIIALVAIQLLPVAAAERSHADYRTEALTAAARGDFPGARQAIDEALRLRPDSPRYLRDLAGITARAGDAAGAIGALRQLAVFGVAPNLERDPELATLQGTPAFRDVLQRLADNRAPQGAAEIFAELPGRSGIIEGIAYRDQAGELFLGDVHFRCVWRRGRDGRTVRFTAADEDLLGIFGLAIDEPRRSLWAAMTAGPEMAGFTQEKKGHAALAEFDLVTGELRRVIDVPQEGRDHGLGDLLVAADGTIYATDSFAPVIWMLAPGAEDLQKVADTPVFSSLQGLAVERGTLLVADYANGLFTIEIGTGNVAALPPPKNTTLLGLDGMVRVPGGIVAVQNGVEPQRILRIGLTPDWAAITSVTVLAAAQPDLVDLSLITLIHGHPAVVGGSGWDLFNPAKMPQPPAHTVRVFQIALP
jgi:hypothetical protein